MSEYEDIAMIVYVLIDAPNYDPSNIIGVYSTREIAESMLIKVASRSWGIDPDYCIEPYTVDNDFPATV